jgi:hypothetical protein
MWKLLTLLNREYRRLYRWHICARMVEIRRYNFARSALPRLQDACRVSAMREEFKSNAFLAVTVTSVLLLGSGLLALAFS